MSASAATLSAENVAPTAAILPKIARELAGLQSGAVVARELVDAGFRGFADSSPLMMWVVDVHGACVFLNRRWQEFTGQSETEGLGAGWLEAVHPEDRARTAEIFHTASLARNGFRLEYRLRRNDGVYCWALDAGEPRFDGAGEFLGYVGSVIDISERKHAEDAARESAGRLQFALSAARLGDWSWDAESDLVTLSERAAQILNVSPDASLTWTQLRELLHPEDRERARREVLRAIEDRSDYDIEYRVRAGGGAWVWVAAKGRGRYGPRGESIGMMGVLQDVTNRRSAEEKMRESEARLRLATSSGKVGVWDWDVVADRVTWTDSLYGMHGVDRESFGGTGAAFVALIHPDDRRPVERAIQSSLQHDVPYELEFRLVRPGGGVVWVFTNAIVVREGGRPVRMIGATFDITARKQAELGLRESEQRFRTLASHAPVGIFLTDVNGDALFVNEVWRAVTGLSPEQARGKGWVSALHSDDRERVGQEWYAAVRERRPFNLEYRFRRPDGAVTWVQGSAVEFRNASGAVVGHLGTVVDITQRKKAEDGLRESEQRFRTLASHAPVGIFLTDPQGETVFVNESWCAMTGLSAENARGRGWARAMHPDDRARVAAEWTAALAENRSSAAEYRFVRADGRVTWVQGNAVQLRDDAGRLVGYIGTVADLSERKTAEDQLRAREAQLRAISMNAPIILAHCSQDERYLFVNRAYAERFGLEPEQVVGRKISDVLGREAYEALGPYIRRVLAGESVDYEIEIPYSAVGARFMRVSYVPDVGSDGRVRGWLAAVTDLTERREMEIALRESEARFRQLADSMPQIVFTADAKGRTDYFNRRWYELTQTRTGVTGDESFVPMLHPDDRQRCLETWYRCVATGEPYQIEYRFHFPERNEYRWHLGRALPMRDAEGNIVRWFGTCTDIHDWKLVQEALRNAQAQLQAHASDLEARVAERTASLREAIAQMEEFSYSVSHDLRAPLRAMNAYAQALVEDYGPQLDDTARGYLERIQRSSVRMEKLTHDVLQYSRVARAEVELSEINLEQLIRDVVMQYRELQPPAAELEIAAPLLAVRGHESSLGQCVANLLTNSVKFIERGVKPRIKVSTELRGDRVRLWIEDNGIGIAPEYQRRLFRVFERVPTRQAYEGTGIGLAIVRKATEKMGGACGVVSDGSNGSRFWIDLPQA